MAMRSIGSISSELCEMQALRDSNATLSAKDLEWQRRILRPAVAAHAASPSRRAFTTAHPQPPPLPPPASAPVAAADPPPYHVASYFAARAAAAAVAARAANVAASAPFAAAPPPPPPPPPDVVAFAHPRPPVKPEPVPSSPPPAATGSPSPSASTHAASPEPGDSPTALALRSRRRPLPPVLHRGIGKIRRHRMTKEEEARFAPEDLVDLRGSTAAKSRKMTDEERDIMLHKRRLRNRQSAARSRDKQRKTIGDVGDEVDELVAKSDDILRRCLAAEKELVALREANQALKVENDSLKQLGLVQQAPSYPSASLPSQQGPLGMRRSGSTLRFSMSSDMLDKIIGGNAADGLLGTGNSSGMLRIPSKLHVSLSTDKLSDGVMPTISGSLPLSRNVSVIERLLDYANNTDNAASNSPIVVNNSTTTTT